jgi:hypothetical protein
MRTRIIALTICLAACAATAHAQEVWDQASENGEAARKAFLACSRFVDGWLQHADPQTGLIPRNLGKDLWWNAKDSAADNYPFMVLSTYYTNRPLFDGRMHAMLETEQRVCNRVGRLPDDFLFATQAFRTEKVDMGAIIFGASEYAKDGLLPMTELMGPSPWCDRMLGLLDDIWANAAVETEVGKLPSTSHEVCGELLQTLCRMHWMTGKEEYRTWAYMLADYFFLHHSPIAVAKLNLDDHGCEVIGGLSEAYFLAAHKDPDRRDQWRPEMYRILDRILEVGRDKNGYLHMLINPVTGEILREELTDNWGYDYNAYLTVAELDGVAKYREAVEFVLTHVMNEKDYPWEGDIADGIADSLEGGINLMNRIPTPQAAEWADHMAKRLLAKQRDTGVIAGWHGDGNFARTALMHALWKTRGAYVHPWRADIRVGAAVDADGAVCFQVAADWPWQGTLHFDVPRHSEWFHMPEDYPRLNQFPEWFTVAEGDTFEAGSGELTGKELRQGVPVSVTPGTPFQLKLTRK